MKRLIFWVLLFVGASASAGGGAGMSIVYDPSNFSKNMVTAAQSIKSVQEQVGIHLQTLRQYQEMIKQGQALASGDIAALGELTGQRDLVAAINDSKALYKSISTLNGDISNIQSRFNFAANMAQKYGMTMAQYAEMEAKKRAAQDASAQARHDGDLQAIAATERAIAGFEKASQSAPSTMQASLTQLNVSLAAVGAQNAALRKYFLQKDILERAEAGSKAGDMKAVGDERAKQAADIKAKGDAARTAEKSSFSKWLSDSKAIK
jgi:type IV secretion system protein TrbJ